MVREHIPLATDISFAFVATRGPGYLGDIAIDDVDVSNKPCSVEGGDFILYSAVFCFMFYFLFPKMSSDHSFKHNKFDYDIYIYISFET